MARARSKICMESNRVNVKHVIGDLGEVEKESVYSYREV